MLNKDEQAWLEATTATTTTTKPTGESAEKDTTMRMLARKGLCRNPGIGQPAAAGEGSQHQGNTAQLLLSDRVAIDGHCSQEFHPALNRASWSIIGLNFGEPTAEKLQVSGPVWDGLPQTSA